MLTSHETKIITRHATVLSSQLSLFKTLQSRHWLVLKILIDLLIYILSKHCMNTASETYNQLRLV